MNKYTCNRN